VFVVDGAGVSMLDARTRRLLHRVVVGRNAPRFPPLAVVVDARHGRAFVVARSEGMVGVLDSRSGRALRMLSVGGRLGSAAVDSGAGRLVVTIGGAPTQAGTLASSGLVGVLDGRGGALPRTIRVGMGPRAVAVDERTGHVVVVTSGGTLPAPATWRWLPAWLRQGLPVLPSPGLRTRAIPHGGHTGSELLSAWWRRATLDQSGERDPTRSEC
jgi:DNA-binding beta-propeller fold protein YncE